MEEDEIKDLEVTIAKRIAEKQSQSNALLDKLVDPENAVNLKLSQRIGKDLDSVSGSERLKKTSETIIDSTLKVEEIRADTKKAKVEKSANEVYFETHSSELSTGGITKATYMNRMEQVVKTNDLWFKVVYFIFLWWVIGINTLNKGISQLSGLFKGTIWLFAGAFCVPFIPLAISIGIIRAVLYLVYLFTLKPIVDLIKKLVHKKQPEVIQPEVIIEEKSKTFDNLETENT